MTDGGWPPPHPSPPEPPPREYGVPGTTPSRLPYVLGAVAVVVVIGLVVLLVGLLTGDDEPEARTTEEKPAASASASASEETPAATTYTCWDGAAAAALEECSSPTGEAGLTWAFPALGEARCGQAAAAGGATTRVLCIARVDGTKVQLGFFEWPGVEQGQAFYDGQGLTRADGTDVVTWTGPGKDATMYAAAPLSVTVTYPEDAGLSAEQLAAFAPRPAAELAGVPAA